jgi:hypothetical protein
LKNCSNNANLNKQANELENCSNAADPPRQARWQNLAELGGTKTRGKHERNTEKGYELISLFQLVIFEMNANATMGPDSSNSKQKKQKKTKKSL